MSGVTQIDPAGLKAKMDAREPFCLLDVREPWEVALASIRGSLAVPMHELPARLEELDATSEIIVMCKAGGRSQRAAEFLAARGYGKVCNLQGGIDAWSRDIDPDVPEY
ncbi:MAG TPA: rhodanese-like domain-containing protein [Steroidobacteraceae bacterium]|jgi:rhodanese-related sulfurtransferase|nr:rhodanese-like domain-containing protein [Steroidobacteraceae bacterium]